MSTLRPVGAAAKIVGKTLFKSSGRTFLVGVGSTVLGVAGATLSIVAAANGDLTPLEAAATSAAGLGVAAVGTVATFAGRAVSVGKRIGRGLMG